MLLAAALGAAEDPLTGMRDRFQDPPVDCRPHTRWWWMGNALSKSDITWQLEQMRQQGITGVEQITMQPVYERGNQPFLSEAYFDLVRHAIREAKRLGMEFSLNFGGPGWIWGGDFVPPEDRCKNLLASSVDVTGGKTIDQELPLDAKLNPRDVPRSRPKIEPGDQVVAVVAGKVVRGVLLESSLTDLTARVRGRRVRWEVPQGDWRLMAFWLTDCSIDPILDHLGKRAMTRYCDFLGGKFRAAFGEEFGKTVESFFQDSFEVPIHRNGIYWNSGLLGEFKARRPYDLVRYLPALWWEVGGISPKIRYDVNEFLHQTGMEAFFQVFLGWCERHGVKGRIQPYGFVTDNLEGAGASHIPEMEITAGEKDAVPWFDTRIGPRTYVASGAHLYGRNVVSVEAYTYLHWQQARDTLEELKISGDIFLRAGANKFYNSGFTATPEREFVPPRRFTAEVLVSPVNTWWPHYRLLADYVARCSAALRNGHPVADIAVYSPLANQWALDVFNARRWTRDFDWGPLGKLILANGYDFDLINDDVLQHRASFSGGLIRVRDLAYRILVLPNVETLPLDTLRRVREFARAGGVVIALEQIPSASTGFTDYRRQDLEVRAIAKEMFRAPAGLDDTAAHPYGSGHTYFLQKVMDRANMLDWKSSVLDPFVNTLRRHVTPDFGIDFVREAWRENNGLMFSHRRTTEADIYFVTNVQEQPANIRVAFRVTGKAPEEWNPFTGEIRPLQEYSEQKGSTVLPVRLAPFGSTIFVFAPGSRPHVAWSDFSRVLSTNERGVIALASHNGVHHADHRAIVVEGIPAPFEIAGDWKLALEGKEFPRTERTVRRLTSWTEDPQTKHFSGTGQYTIGFELPASYVARDLVLDLSLGDVGDIADVSLNGTRVGVAWMRGQSLDVSKAVRRGKNTLTIAVTNTLINRVSGWKKVPELPAELRPLYGAGLESQYGVMRDLYGFEPLPRSGLLGPIRLTPFKRVHVEGR